jgi:hypothetical protein
MIPLLILPRKAKPLHVDVADGMELKKISGRQLLATRGTQQKFEGSWWVRLKSEGASGNFRVTVDRGYVNEMEPTIGGVPISGVLDGEPVASGQPYLSFAGAPAWVCLKITPNKEGKLDVLSGQPAGLRGVPTSSVTIEINRGISGKSIGSNWFYPIASISQYGKVAQFAYFDISYKAYKKSGDSQWRHRTSLSKANFQTIADILEIEQELYKTDMTVSSGATTYGREAWRWTS